jgi:hypothetical protein
MDVRAQVEAELARGAAARARGNEGRARVCARRAAGLAVREYLNRHSEVVRSLSAVDLLEQLRQSPGLPPDWIPRIDHLMLRVDEEFRLPAEVDLLADARRLCDDLTRS